MEFERFDLMSNRSKMGQTKTQNISDLKNVGSKSIFWQKIIFNGGTPFYIQLFCPYVCPLVLPSKHHIWENQEEEKEEEVKEEEEKEEKEKHEEQEEEEDDDDDGHEDDAWWWWQFY